MIGCGGLLLCSLISHYLSDILCKNCNYIFLFVKVMPKILVVPFFSGHGVECSVLIYIENRQTDRHL